MNIDNLENIYKQGNHILVFRWNNTYNIEDSWTILNNPAFFNDERGDYVLINKKHKHILDAYLLDNDVEIDKYINIHEHYNTSNEKFQWTKENEFISNYDENIKYRLLDIIEPFDDSKEYITVPNSDKKFLKPEFECVIYEEIKHKVSGIVFYIGRVYKEKEGYYPCSFEEDGSCFIEPCGNAKEFNLAPYEEPKPWYEIESNYPCVLFSNDTGMFIINRKCDFIEGFANKNKYRFATNEEIDSLKIKE